MLSGDILTFGYIDNNIFYIITSTKIFLYDVLREVISNEYFLYDTLYKDLFLIKDNPSYQTIIKRHNQIQSTVHNDYCYFE